VKDFIVVMDWIHDTTQLKLGINEDIDVPEPTPVSGGVSSIDQVNHELIFLCSSLYSLGKFTGKSREIETFFLEMKLTRALTCLENRILKQPQ